MSWKTASILLVLLAGPAGAAGPDETLYASLLERHTREVRDIARVRVDDAALAKSDDWRRLVESLELARKNDAFGLVDRSVDEKQWPGAQHLDRGPPLFIGDGDGNARGHCHRR